MDEIKKVAGTGALGIAPAAILGNQSSPTSQPTESKPVMPVADERTAREARRRAIIKQASRGGRTSTILTDRETLG